MAIRQQDERGIAMTVTPGLPGRIDEPIDFALGQVLTGPSLLVGDAPRGHFPI
jgi:hypothetical protein